MTQQHSFFRETLLSFQQVIVDLSKAKLLLYHLGQYSFLLRILSSSANLAIMIHNITISHGVAISPILAICVYIQGTVICYNSMQFI